MDKICPICNALERITKLCPNCGQQLIDGGTIQNYLGPYSPYMESEGENTCLHLLYCPQCHHDLRAVWELVVI